MFTSARFKISIAMATFNGGKYLQNQLDTFVCQERLPDELVVCDDGSTDSTLKILEIFKDSAPFEVLIIKNDLTLGYTKNFEKALSACTGDLIFLADQDDVWFPAKIAVIEQALLEKPDKFLIIHDGVLVDEALVSYGATKRGQVVAGYGNDDSFITGALTVVQRKFLSFLLPIPDGINGHDGWLHNIARLLGKRFVLNQSLQYIRRHTSNTSSWIASSLQPINIISVAKSQLSTMPATSYQDRLLYNAELIKRLSSIGEMPDGVVFRDLISQRHAELQIERKSIIRREKLLSQGFFNRKVMAFRMLVICDYKYFNGLKSFLRDFTR